MRTSLIVGTTVLVLANIDGAAMAQTTDVAADADAGTGIQDIVVTARKRAENVQNVPVAISAISGDALATRGLVQTNDLAGSVPNLQIQSPYGTSQPNFTLRGVGVANEFNSNSASPVGVYVDEVYQTFRSSHGQQLYDLDRIEVVRGPQGTLYGRNTTGGAVNFITQKPKLSGISGYGSVGYGNYDRVRAEGALDATLVEDMLGVRLSGQFSRSDGYLKNSVGLDGASDKSYGFRGTVRWKATPDLDISLKGYMSRSTGSQEIPIAVNATPTGTGPITFGLLGGAFGFQYDRSNLGSKEVEADGVGNRLIRAEGAVLTAAYSATDDVTITSITGYDSGKYAQLPFQDCDGTPFDFCATGYQSDFQAFNQELRFNYDGDRLKFVGGLYYGWDRIDTFNRLKSFGVLSGIREALGLPASYFNPAGFGVIADPLALPTTIRADIKNSQTRRSKAIYGEGVFDVSDQFSLTVGLRYTGDKGHYYNGLATLFDDAGTPRLITVSSSPVAVLPGPNVTPLTERGSSNALSGRVIASYKPSEDVMLYASYSRGYRAGTFNGFAFQDNSQVNFVPPEKVNAYEIGFKSRILDNAMQINGALFQYDYQGQQVQEIIGARALSVLRSLDGRIRGGELEIQYRPVSTVQIALSGGFLDSKYDSGQTLSGIDISGNEFPFAADVSFNGSVDWTVTTIGDGDLSLYGEAVYTGKYFYDPFGNRQATGPMRLGGGDYWLLNGRMSYTAERYTISAWVKNLADKLYFPYALNLEAGFGIDYLSRGAPRTFGVDVTFRF